MPENSALFGSRTWWLLSGLILAFVLGLGTGLVIPRQGKHEANLAPQHSVQNEVVLQTGEIDPFNRDFTFDVFYQLPFAVPPELKIVDWGPLVEAQIVEQWPHGFRLKIASRGWPDGEKRRLGRYEARGVLAEPIGLSAEPPAAPGRGGE